MAKLYILCGIPFSGKTYLAERICREKGFVRVDLDEIKFELYGREVKDGDLKQENWDTVYKLMYKRIEEFLKTGKGVVHDTGNFTKYERDLVRMIANKLGLNTTVIYVDTPRQIAFERLVENRKTKGRFDVADKDFESAVEEMEPPTASENIKIFHYNDNIKKWIEKNI